jgi:glutamyl-tRNA reductase
MILMALGVNYQTAPIHIRERLAFDFEGGANVARLLVDNGLVSEAVLVSTCNRTELYCEGEDSPAILQFLIEHCGLTYSSIAPYTYIHSDLIATKHLMRVASGLDSMVLGEGEILGQLKKAYTASANAGTVGKYLGRLFQATFAIAKLVRTNTSIGVNPVSVAYAAVRLSQQIFSDLSKTSVLLIGAGDLISLTAQHLVGMGVKKIMVANRTLERARHLAAQFGGESLSLEQIPERLTQADVVITGTNSAYPIIDKKMVERALYQQKRRAIFMVDLSVPRDIESTVGDYEDIYLYCIDDLQHIVEENRRVRSHAASDAEEMISLAAEQLMNWRYAQDFFKTLSVFRQKFEEIRDQILQESYHKLTLGEDPAIVLQKLAHRLTNRFLHEPTRRLRMAGISKEETLLALTRDLFELSHETINTK